MASRTNAGASAKYEGHAFESAVAKHLGPTFKKFDDGEKKTDITSIDGHIRISLKNSANRNTQVALISQNTLIRYLALNSDGQNFVKLFFGLAGGDKLNQSKLNSYGLRIEKLSDLEEVMRNRLLFSNIPLNYSNAFMSAINEKSKNGDFYNRIISGNANIIGWAKIKNVPESVQFARMNEVNELLKKGQWRVSSSQSTLELLVNDTRLMYVQMKGSSTKYSAGYHSCMFHLHREVMDLVNSFVGFDGLEL